MLNPYIKKCIDLLFPATCPSCRADLDPKGSRYLCSLCYSKIKWIHQYQLNKKHLHFIYSAVEYEGPVRDLLHAYKYNGRDYLTPFLMQIWLKNWNFPWREIDCIVPVPMSYLKELKRGFNQAHLLAEDLGKRISKPVQSSWLWRRPLSSSQTHFSKVKRLQNAKNNFLFKREKTKEIKGKSILLVDDILTTGATLQICAKLLIELGARRVWGSTIAQDRIKIKENQDVS